MDGFDWNDLAEMAHEPGPIRRDKLNGLDELLDAMRCDEIQHDNLHTYTCIEERGASRYLWEVWPDRFDVRRGWRWRATNLRTKKTDESDVLLSILGVGKTGRLDVIAGVRGTLSKLPTLVWRRVPMEQPAVNFVKERDRVYVLGCAESPLVKIGYSNDVERRRDEIQHMSPVRLLVLWTGPGNRQTEAVLHHRFADRRAHGEWFDLRVNHDEAVALVAAEWERLRE